MSTSTEEYISKKTKNIICLICWAVVMILLVLILWSLMSCRSGKKEHYNGYGLPYTPEPLTSGSILRFQQLTGTNQGQTPVDTPTWVQLLGPGLKRPKPKPIQPPLITERMTSMREFPIYNDPSDALGVYQYAQQFSCNDGAAPLPVRDSYGNVSYVCGDGSTPVENRLSDPANGIERATSYPATAVQEALLMSQLGY